MSDQSGSKLRIPCWHLWSDGHGISRQTRCSFKGWELKGVDAAAARRNNKHPRSKAIVVFTTQLVSRIERTELDGTITVLADPFEGKRLNSPDDIICRSDGTVWFTDPIYGISTDYEGGKHPPELPEALYRLDPGSGTLTAMATGLDGPNGLAFSLDERLIYVSQSGAQFAANPNRHIKVYEVGQGGMQLGPARVFHTVEPGNADGFRCDEHGNIWSSAADGVHCIAPDGRLLGVVRVPHTVANLCFGGRNRSRLFLCASQTLYAIYLNVRGSGRP